MKIKLTKGKTLLSRNNVAPLEYTKVTKNKNKNIFTSLPKAIKKTFVNIFFLLLRFVCVVPPSVWD